MTEHDHQDPEEYNSECRECRAEAEDEANELAISMYQDDKNLSF